MKKRMFQRGFIRNGLILFLLFTCSTVWANDVVIVKNNKTEWRIASLSNTEEVRFASSELQKYLFQMGKVKLPVETNEKSASNIVVCLRKDLPAKYRSLLPSQKSGYDGYTIVVSDKSPVIIIAGDNGPGVIYGVYDFLERLGCRWFYPTQDINDPEVVPELNTISIEPISLSSASAIKYRIYNGAAWFFSMNYNTAESQLDWAMKNRYNAMGWQASPYSSERSLLTQYKDLEDAGLIAELKKRGMFLHGPAHSFDQFLKSDVYFDNHPEWFGLVNGKRVPQIPLWGAQFSLSNAAARKQFIENAVTFITQAPMIHIFSIWPFDGGKACECEECKKAGGASNLLMVLMSELIDTLKTIRPDLIVETIGGYGPVANLPTNVEAINPKLRLIWAQWGRNMQIGYDNPRYNKKNLDGWRKVAKGGFTLCQYYTDNFAEPWIMGPFTKAMKSDRRYFLKNQVDAFYALSWSAGYWWNHSLNGYLAGRSFYDVSIDPFSLIRDYAMHYFGPKAGPLLADYYEEWAQNIELSYHIRHDSDEKDREMLKKERREWIDPAVEVTKSDKVYAYRVSKVEKLHSLAEDLTETHRLHHLIQKLRKEGDFNQAERILGKARIQTDSVMLTLYTLSDLNQGLIDRGDIAGFTKAAIKGWIDQEAKLIDEKQHSHQEAPKKMDETEMLPTEVIN